MVPDVQGFCSVEYAGDVKEIKNIDGMKNSQAKMDPQTGAFPARQIAQVVRDALRDEERAAGADDLVFTSFDLYQRLSIFGNEVAAQGKRHRAPVAFRIGQPGRVVPDDEFEIQIHLHVALGGLGVRRRTEQFFNRIVHVFGNSTHSQRKLPEYNIAVDELIDR